MFCCLLLCAISTSGQSDTLAIRADDFQGLELTGDFFGWAVDSSGGLPPEKAQHLPFQSFGGVFQLKRAFAYWFRFSVFNDSPDSFGAVLCFEKFTRTDLFYEETPGGWVHKKAGNWTNFSDRSFPPNKFCHTISLLGKQRRTYLVQITDYPHPGEVKPHFRLLPFQKEKEERMERAALKSGHQLFKGIFFGILVLLVFYTLLQYRLHRDRAYLFYACYSAALFLFYLRSMELHSPLPFLGDLRAFHPNFEALLGYLCYIFYLSFVRHFLELRAKLPHLDRLLRLGVYFFTGLLVIDLLILQVFWGWKISLKVHEITKKPFFVLALLAAATVVARLKNRLAIYVLGGTALLLIPSIFTVLADSTPGTYKGIWCDTARTFSPLGSDLKFYMYDVKVGVLLEMMCFLLGLSYKARQDQLRLNSLHEEIERLKNANGSFARITAATASPVEDPFVKEARSLVEANLSNEQFGAPQLWEALRMSKSSCSRNMKKLTGLTPTLFIREIRLQKALELLATTSLPIKEVAYSTGFGDPAFFSKVFKERFQMTPSDVRNGKKDTDQ